LRGGKKRRSGWKGIGKTQGVVKGGREIVDSLKKSEAYRLDVEGKKEKKAKKRVEMKR